MMEMVEARADQMGLRYVDIVCIAIAEYVTAHPIEKEHKEIPPAVDFATKDAMDRLYK